MDAFTWNEDNADNTNGGGETSTNGRPGSSMTDFDFSGATRPCQWPEITNENLPDRKHFLVCKKNDDDNIQPVRFTKDHTEEIFQVISQLLGIPEKRLIMRYPIKTITGEKTLYTVKHSNRLNEALEIFYCQATEMSTLVIEEQKKEEPRGKRPCENTFSNFSKMQVINKTSYEVVQNDLFIGNGFLEKLDFVRILLGSKTCVNFLNPSVFLCSIQNCKSFVKLNYYNNMSKILVHFKEHVLKTEDEEIARILVKRYLYIHENKYVKSHKHLSLSEKIRQLEDINDECGNSLAIRHLQESMHLPKRGINFKGKTLLMKNEIVEKLVNMEPDALSRMQDSPDIRNFLAPHV